MQQAKLRKRFVGIDLLSGLILLVTFAILNTTRTVRGQRTVGLMPEVVCTADRSNCVTGEIIVRASRPGNVDAVARLSGIN